MARTTPTFDPDTYAAQEITPALLAGIMDASGTVNASDAGFHPPARPEELTAAQVHHVVARMMHAGAGERFPVGPTDLIALRFVCEGRRYTIVTLEDAATPEGAHPALVDGHLTEREEAVWAWLGDTMPDEHPELALFPDAA